jgi:plastocyanin
LDTVHRRLIGLALAGTLALALTACGDDDDDADTSDTTAETTADTGETADTTAETTADSGATDTTEAAAGDVVEVTGVDYGYEGIPTTPVPVGTQIAFHNASDVEAHELVALPIPADETRSVGELLQLPEAELETLFGSAAPAMVLLAGPGDVPPQINAVGDGTFAEAGRYMIICSIPVGADPSIIESEGPPAEDPNAGPPHFTEGMAAEITVE